MNSAHRMKFAFVACVALVFASACSKKTSTSVLQPAEVPAALDQAFAKAAGEAQQAATESATAVQNNDPATAFETLQKLSSRPDLTPEQRATTARAMAASFKQLRSAAEGGNTRAQAVMQHYQATR
jgi:hypothetical protein